MVLVMLLFPLISSIGLITMTEGGQQRGKQEREKKGRKSGIEMGGDQKKNREGAQIEPLAKRLKRQEAKNRSTASDLEHFSYSQ